MHPHFSPHGGWPQICRVQRPADAQVGPEPRARDQREGRGGAEVEDGRRAAAVEVGEAVAVWVYEIKNVSCLFVYGLVWDGRSIGSGSGAVREKDDGWMDGWMMGCLRDM